MIPILLMSSRIFVLKIDFFYFCVGKTVHGKSIWDLDMESIMYMGIDAV